MKKEKDFEEDEWFESVSPLTPKEEELIDKAIRQKAKSISIEERLALAYRYDNQTRKYRILMNRTFREKHRLDVIPFPQVDNAFERLRSKIVVKIKK